MLLDCFTTATIGITINLGAFERDDSLLLSLLLIFTLFLISVGESVRKMDDVTSDALIFDLAPCRAGKKIECRRAHLGKFRRAATSRVIRKYGSCRSREQISDKKGKKGISTWSIAHGMRHDNSSLMFSPKMNGNVELIAGAAWMAGKAIFPIESLSVKPKMAEKQRVLSMRIQPPVCRASEYLPLTLL